MPLRTPSTCPASRAQPTKPLAGYPGCRTAALRGSASIFRNLRVLKKLYLPEKECREIKHSYYNLSCVKAEDSHKALAYQAAGAPHPAEE